MGLPPAAAPVTRFVARTVGYGNTAEVAPDGLSVRLRIQGLVQGHIPGFNSPALKPRYGEPLLHTDAYYTLNEIPKP